MGALNMHGSMLPRYRGRAPVNWAILHGERETGATLHYMTARADAGDIVDQLAVPILENDEARDIFGKVTVAAEIILARSLPGLIAGTAPKLPQKLEAGQYFGRRRPEDGRIDWTSSARAIHNLVRAVAPPFPGAFGQIDGQRWMIHKTRVEPRTIEPSERARLFGADGCCYVACCDGGVLHILAAANDSGPIDLSEAARELQQHPGFTELKAHFGHHRTQDRRRHLSGYARRCPTVGTGADPSRRPGDVSFSVSGPIIPGAPSSAFFVPASWAR